MKCLEPGILKNSNYYFSSPSSLAKKLYFYCICAGEFNCIFPYRTHRKSYNSFLLMYILEGECIVKVKHKSLIAKAGDYILLNCYEPHEYYTMTSLHFYFIHFDGNVSEEFYHLIVKNSGNIFNLSEQSPVPTLLNDLILHYAQQSTLSEGKASCIIHEILCCLLSTYSLSTDSNSPIQTALEFIQQNYQAELSLSQIAQSVNLSPYHFSRLFKKEAGYSPYEYLTYYRLEKAKKLLKTSQKTIEEISFLTGFKSESNFIYCFHKNIGMSPGNFRKLPF